MADDRRKTLMNRIGRVTSVERLRTLGALAQAQSDAVRSKALAERCKGLADNGSARSDAMTADALQEVMNFSSAMSGIASDADHSRARAEETIAQASRDLARIDRKLERISHRTSELHRESGRKAAGRADPVSQQGLARKLLNNSRSQSHTPSNAKGAN